MGCSLLLLLLLLQGFVLEALPLVILFSFTPFLSVGNVLQAARTDAGLGEGTVHETVEKRLGKGNVGFSALGVPHHCLLQRLRIICPVILRQDSWCGGGGGWKDATVGEYKCLHFGKPLHKGLLWVGGGLRTRVLTACSRRRPSVDKGEPHCKGK